MDADEVVRRLGGVATREALVQRCGRAGVDTALIRGRIEAVGRGRYALPTLAADRRTAHALAGVLSHESAALAHGWPVLHVPERPHVTVPRKRKVRGEAEAVMHWADLDADDVQSGVTSAARTLGDCLRALPAPDALAVADSVLRSGRTPGWLRSVAEGLRGPGSARARDVAARADAGAANPFESGLRAVAFDAGLDVRPQVQLFSRNGEFLGRPDLVDVERRLILEADSFAWHGSRSGLVRDARRYNGFVVEGWSVLRFTWEDVVLEPGLVLQTLGLLVDGQAQRAPRAQRGLRPAVVPVRLRGSHTGVVNASASGLPLGP